MMGDALPAATPAPVPAASAPAASPATTAQASGARANAGAAQDEAPAGTPPGLFDLLLTSQPASAPAVSPSQPRDASGEQAPADPDARDGASVDPLQVVLAQVLPAQAPAAPGAVGTDNTTGTIAIAEAGAPSTEASLQRLVMPLRTAVPAMTNPSPAPSAFPASTTDVAAETATALAAGNATAGGAPEALELPRAPSTPADAAPLLPQAVAGAPAPVADTIPGPAVAVAATPLSQPADPASGYDDSFGTQVAWLAEQRIGEAQIRVSPEHLGAIDIRLQLDGREVRAEFHSAQPEVRQALEASLPRLRDMLGQHGLQLAHAGVGQGHRQRDGTPFAQAPGTTSRNEGDADPSPGFRRTRGLLDVYA